MTLRELMERLDVPPMLVMAAGPLLAMRGVDQDAEFGIDFDRVNERVRFSLEGTTIFRATFDQIEETIRDNGAGFAVDGGRAPGDPGVPGTRDPVASGVPGTEPDKNFGASGDSAPGG